MKTFAYVVLLVAVAVAEPPRYRNERLRPQRQEQAEAAPYPAAGYKPETEFNLPSRQELQPPSTSYGVPTDSYAAPVNSYATPQTQYGAPQAESRSNEKSEGKNKEKKENADNNEAVEIVESERKGKLEDGSQSNAEVVSAQGAYYVLLPGSQLQRVQFRTENDLRNMAYTARLRYSDAERAPLYVYTAQPAAPSAAAAAAYLQLF